MKTTAQLRLAAAALFISSTISLGSVYYFLNQIRNVVRGVNTAGIVRGRTQRLVKLELAGQRSDELIAEIDRLTAGLINGDVSLGLPRVQDPEVLQQYQAIAKSWHNLKRFIADFRTNPTAKDSLINYSENYWEITNDGVTAVENYSSTKLFRYQVNILIIFALNLVVASALVGIIFYLQNNLKNNLKTLANYSTEIASTIIGQELLTQKQAIAVDQTKIIMGKLNHFSQDSIEQVIQVNYRAEEVKNLVEHSHKTEEKILADLVFLSDNIEKFYTEIVDIREQTKQIATISELVSELANHTNMLALNASMEATRAGEKGKEFALVAKEIRQLSNQSQKAGEKIYLLIAQVKQNIKSTVSFTDNSRQIFQQKLKITRKMLNEFEQIVEAMNAVFLNSEEITAIARQQGAIVQEALAAIQEINRAAQASAAGMSEAKKEMEQLEKVASNLKAII
ncbi:methyl-accepting chemotaxis protein [Planktothricoides raciborskii]|uniref:Methyl-accepting chemotaxis protein n=1 Tax=Planktothricoides raciborskii GIHE-MW2 TaxID=2792601 RepID=A0AAU8JEM0_9CYAN